jgi:hypothetical protein
MDAEGWWETFEGLSATDGPSDFWQHLQSRNKDEGAPRKAKRHYQSGQKGVEYVKGEDKVGDM